MNKDEILEKSRKENEAQDERERLTLAQAGRIATAVGGCVCAVIILLDAVLSDAPSFAAWAVYLSMTGTTLLVKFLKLRKKHELLIVPSDDFGCEGYVRISYCVARSTIENSLPAFKALFNEYNK